MADGRMGDGRMGDGRMGEYGRSLDKEKLIEVPVRQPPFDGYGYRDVTGHRKKVLHLAWNCDGRRLASGAADKSIRIWAVEPHCSVAKSERSEAEYTSHGDVVSFLEWRPDHPDIVASISGTAAKTDTNVRFHDARANKQTAAVSLSDRSMAFSWAPDGNSLVVVTYSNDLVFIDTRKMKKHKQWSQTGHDQMLDVRWGPTPAHLTLALDDGTVRIVPTTRLDSPIWRLQAHASGTNCIVYSRNLKYMASGGNDGLVSLWDLDDMLCLRTFARPDQTVRALSFSYEAKWLAYGSEDNVGMIDIMNVQTGELACSLTLKQHTDCVTWSPTAPVLAFSGEETKEHAPITLWAPLKPV